MNINERVYEEVLDIVKIKKSNEEIKNAIKRLVDEEVEDENQKG